MEQAKTVADIAQSCAAVVAVFVGGLWSVWLFRRQRAGYPKAKLSHDVQAVALTRDTLLVRVSTRIENTGTELISVGALQTRLHRVAPLTEREATSVAANLPREATWPLLDKKSCSWDPEQAEVEPGESEVIVCDFVVDASTEAVEVYSYLKNQTKGSTEIGWHATTLVALPDPIGASSMPKYEPPSPSPRREERQLPPRLPVNPEPRPIINPPENHPAIMPQLPPRPDPSPPPPQRPPEE